MAVVRCQFGRTSLPPAFAFMAAAGAGPLKAVLVDLGLLK